MPRLNVSCLSCRILLTDVAKKIYVVATGQTGKKGKKKRKKTTAIRRTAIRETSVWWHRGGPIEDPPETSRTISALYRIEGFNGGP